MPDYSHQPERHQLSHTKTRAVTDTAISTLLGGLTDASARYPRGQTLDLWRRLASGELDGRGLLSALRDDRRLSFLALDTTGRCDLACPGMCYYHPGIDATMNAAPVEALEKLVADAHTELHLKSLVFAGKEPLLNADLFFHLANFAARLPSRNFTIGLVTNGRSLMKQWDRLDTLALTGGLSFLDISLDSGVPEEHDAIRGVRGTFVLARTALERCSAAWKDVRVGAASVLRGDNAEGILTLLRDTSRFNRNFFIAPMQPPPFTETPPLRWSQVREFLSSIIRLLHSELRDRDLQVKVSLLGLHLGDASRDGFFQWNEIQEDAAGQCFAERTVGGNRLQLVLQVLPETGWRGGRVTYTGAYLPNAHFLQVPQPERFALGYVQEEPLTELYSRALSDDGVLGKMLLSRDTHLCRHRSCWQHCFGGLAGAEHSFVGGAPLNRQPALCQKTDADFADRL